MTAAPSARETSRGVECGPLGARRPARSAEVETMIEAEARRLGVERRAISDDEILKRCTFALINEGAEILAAGIVGSAADIDAIWCNGYGFPRYRGGPLWYADTIGLAQVVAGIRALAVAHGERHWTASPLLIELAERGACFAAWHNKPSTR